MEGIYIPTPKCLEKNLILSLVLQQKKFILNTSEVMRQKSWEMKEIEFKAIKLYSPH